MGVQVLLILGNNK